MKKVKFILPAIAVVFAVVGVFATENAPTTVAEDVTLGYLLTSGANCDKDGTCSTGGSTCELNSGVQPHVRAGDPITCTATSTGTFAL